MGDGVSGAGKAPAQQPTNRSGDTSKADVAAKAKFNEHLQQESCPPGLSMRAPKDCLRPPGPEKKPDLTIHHDPGSSKGPVRPSSDGPDLTKPVPKKPDSSIKLPTNARPTYDSTPNGTPVPGIKIPI
jgi:hypothetical protein